jgi:hypothetical protein
MKRLVVILAAALVAVAVYAVTAPAGPEAVSPKRVAALEKRVAKTQRDLRTLTTAVNNCLLVGAAPVAQFGNNATEGYFYGNGQGQFALETAVDLVPANQQAQAAWLLGTTASCAQALNSSQIVTPKMLAALRPGEMRSLASLQRNP